MVYFPKLITQDLSNILLSNEHLQVKVNILFTATRKKSVEKHYLTI